MDITSQRKTPSAIDHLKIIDVTLRDGGYKTNFHFNEFSLTKIITSLNKSGIDYIEIGYKNGSAFPIKEIGRSGLCENDYLLFCKKLATQTKLAVMLHPKNVSPNDITELAGCGIDLIRICISKNNIKESYLLIESANKAGIEISINVTRASQYSEKELNNLINHFNSHHINMIYFADSNGSMHPSKIYSLYQKHSQKVSFSLGFHAHDNLGLAQSNTIAAIEGGARYIDTSMAGIGKGIGNLKTELFVAYLDSLNIKKYKINDLVSLSNFISDRLLSHENITLQGLQMGIFDLSFDQVNEKIYGTN